MHNDWIIHSFDQNCDSSGRDRDLVQSEYFSNSLYIFHYFSDSFIHFPNSLYIFLTEFLAHDFFFFPQKMVYLLGVNLPDNKLVSIALTHIYGIGRSTGEKLTHQLYIHPTCRLRDLPEDKLVQLSAKLNSLKIEADLKRQVSNNIRKLVDMGSYRGNRHKSGMPVKGQKTRSNARTARKLNGFGIKYGNSASFST